MADIVGSSLGEEIINLTFPVIGSMACSNASLCQYFHAEFMQSAECVFGDTVGSRNLLETWHSRDNMILFGFQHKICFA